MKKKNFLEGLKMSFLFLLAMLVFNQNGISQKNTIRVTPLKFAFGKTNFSYERNLNKQWSVLIDAQPWFIEDRERKENGFLDFDFSFGAEPPPVTETNKGVRFSLEFRLYHFLKESEKMKRNFYTGVGGFAGKHHISMERKYESHTFAGWFGGSSTTTYPKLNGEVDLISGGIHFNFGYQVIFKDKLKLEFGFLTGGAWTNQENDFLVLYNYEPYNLEPETDTIKESYTTGISGAFIQPMFNVGFSF